MYRGSHIAISLMAIVLLVRPFDCFATGASSQKAADCCLKGKCAPTAKSDECCKNTVPDSNQLVTSKAADHSFPWVAFTVVRLSNLISSLTFERLTSPVKHPPPRDGVNADSLPLLI
jgi:hypothetical protein